MSLRLAELARVAFLRLSALVNQGQNDFFNLMRKASPLGAARQTLRSRTASSGRRIVQTVPITVSPTCNAATKGGAYFVTDANSTSPLASFVHDALRGLLLLMEPNGLRRVIHSVAVICANSFRHGAAILAYIKFTATSL